MSLFPLTAAMVEQIAAYVRFTWEKRDPRALVWAAVFFLVCAIPAIVIDLVLLPSRSRDVLFPAVTGGQISGVSRRVDPKHRT